MCRFRDTPVGSQEFMEFIWEGMFFENFLINLCKGRIILKSKNIFQKFHSQRESGESTGGSLKLICATSAFISLAV